MSERSTEPSTKADAALLLDDEEGPLVAAEATAAARVLEKPRAEAARRLADAAAVGVVPAESLPVLADILAASLQGRRARRLYRAEGEKVLAGVLARSPAGRARQNEIEALNAALSSLEGRRLESVRVAMRIPGHFVVRVATDDLTLALEISPDSVAVESVTL